MPGPGTGPRPGGWETLAYALDRVATGIFLLNSELVRNCNSFEIGWDTSDGVASYRRLPTRQDNTNTAQWNHLVVAGFWRTNPAPLCSKIEAPLAVLQACYTFYRTLHVNIPHFSGWPVSCFLRSPWDVESSWNVTAHGDARELKRRGNWRMEWVASTLRTASEHGVSGITTAGGTARLPVDWTEATADLNGLARYRWKTKSDFCACATMVYFCTGQQR